MDYLLDKHILVEQTKEWKEAVDVKGIRNGLYLKFHNRLMEEINRRILDEGVMIVDKKSLRSVRSRANGGRN